jgi:CheY-like chemotaxis protein
MLPKKGDVNMGGNIIHDEKVNELRSRKFSMDRANLHANHDMQTIGAVVTVALGIILFEVIPEKNVWSIPVKQADEHLIAVPTPGGFSLLLMQKEDEHKSLTNEEDYKKQYHYRKRILIVDDDPDITLAFEKGLRDKGFEQIDTANNPLLFLKNFKAGSYDLLIIDVVMQQMDGFRLFEEIRKKDKKVKVCFISASYESCISSYQYY